MWTATVAQPGLSALLSVMPHDAHEPPTIGHRHIAPIHGFTIASLTLSRAGRKPPESDRFGWPRLEADSQGIPNAEVRGIKKVFMNGVVSKAIPGEVRALEKLKRVLELQATRVVTVGAIAGELTLEHSSASRLLAECEQEGLIHRARDELDGRKTVVTLTERGSQVATTAKMMHSEFLRSLLADWKSKEIAAFASLLDRFSDSVGTVLTDVTNRIDNAIVDDTRARVERLIARGGAEQPHA